MVLYRFGRTQFTPAEVTPVAAANAPRDFGTRILAPQGYCECRTVERYQSGGYGRRTPRRCAMTILVR